MLGFDDLIGAGIGLIGSLFGGSGDDKTTTTTSTVNYKAMVRSAEAAGFNPLTAIRNGGSAGFATTTSTTPGASLSSRLVQGLQSDGVKDFISEFDPMKDMAKELQYATMEKKLAQLSSGGADPVTARAYSPGQSFGNTPSAEVPNYSMGTVGARYAHGSSPASADTSPPEPVAIRGDGGIPEARLGSQNAARSRSGREDDPFVWDPNYMPFSGNETGGYKLKPGLDPAKAMPPPKLSPATITDVGLGNGPNGMPDADSVETSYGDPVMWAYAPVKLWHDANDWYSRNVVKRFPEFLSKAGDTGQSEGLRMFDERHPGKKHWVPGGQPWERGHYE